MDSERHGILGQKDTEVRVQSMRRLEFDLEAEYHSPELSHDHLAKSDVTVEDKTKEDGLAESIVPLENEADNHGLAVPVADTTKRDGLAESNILVESTTMGDGAVEPTVPIEDAASKDGRAVSKVSMGDKAKKVGLTESNSLMELSEHNAPLEDTSKKHGLTDSKAAMELIGNNAFSEDAAKIDELIENNVSSEDAVKKDELIVSNFRIEDITTKVGLTKSNGPGENTAKKVGLMESNIPMENKRQEDGLLDVGLEFESEEKAYDFYNQYAGNVGFSVRKDWLNKSKNGIVQSRRYCCSKEGYRRKDPRDKCLKNPSKETRTGCLAHMIIALQPNGKYRIIQLEATHNHELVSPDKAHLLKSQRKLAPAQVARVNKADAFGMPTMGGQGTDDQNINYPPVCYKNYLHSKRMKAMKQGNAGGLLQYFQRMQLENPFFFYAIQLDMFDQITNMFWTDAKMVADYDHFGDVVCFDTTYSTNDFDLPFALFTGVNHHKQTVIFGAALLYDETTESFKWLFETFIEAMLGKMPKTILTDQSEAMAMAIAIVLPETYHRICVWQIYQNARVRHLTTVFGGSKSFDRDFSNCIFDYEEQEDFIQAWESMLDKYDLRGNTWLQKLFLEKEKWALAYGRHAFCADMKSTQLNESMNSILRNHLNHEPELVQIFQHFERLVEEQRCAELKSSYGMSQSTERLLIPVKILKQAADVYTAAIFEMFKAEFIQSLDYVVNLFSKDGTLTEYKITVDGIPHEHVVTFNSSDEMIICSCRKFEFVGILCSHALKVLDHRNVKVVPPQYILKRWTKHAKVGTVKDGHTCAMQVDSKFNLLRHYKDLCHNIASIATRAAETEEAFTFAAFYLDKMLQGVEGTLRRTSRKIANFCESEYTENLCVERVDSSSENVEILLNQIMCQKDSSRVDDADVCNDDDRGRISDGAKSTKVKGNKRKGGDEYGRSGTNSAEGSLRSKQSPNFPPAPSTIFNNPCSPQAFYTTQAPSRALFTQGSFGFEENPLGLTSMSHDQDSHHMFHCTYQPDFSFMHQPHNLAMNQLPHSSTNQRVFLSCIQFPQESLAPSLYQESASSSSHFS